MDASIDLGIKQDIFQQIKQLSQQFEQLNGKVDTIEKNTKSSFSSIASSIKSISFASITQSLSNLNQGFQDLNAPGMSFSSAMADVSAITGVTGKQLDELGKKARESAKEFGGSATDSLESYKTILSRLGPDIAKDQRALADMERNVRILSKTMGGDATASVDALTTAMLQYGVDLSNPAKAQKEMSRMMNVMAAGAKFGAAEVPQISEALKVSGVAAKQANVSFEETNAALQSLAAGGKEGSEAGTALRNVLGKMAGEDVIPKEAAAKLKKLGVDMNIVSNTTLPFSTRLKELKKAQGDATIMAQVFGTENAAAANILLSSVDAQEKLTKQITGTNSAMEQAAIVMESPAEKLARMKARVDDVKISFFEATGGATAYLEPVSQLAMTFSSFMPLISGAGKAFQWLGKTKIATSIATKIVTAAQWLWNAALAANPIGLVVVGLAALAAGIYATVKAFSASSSAAQLNAQISQRVTDKTIDQRVEVDKLFRVLKTAKVGSDEYKDTLKEIDRISPGLTDKYNLQAGALKDINAAEVELIKNIKKRAEAEVLGEMLRDATKKRIQFDEFQKKNKGKNNGLLDLPGLDDKSLSKQKQFLVNQENDLLKRLGKVENSMQNSGIATDVPTGTNPPGNPPALVTTSGYGNSSSNYSGAGGEVKSINVRIENLIKEFTISSTTINESAAGLRNKITEALTGAVRDFEVSM